MVSLRNLKTLNNRLGEKIKSKLSLMIDNHKKYKSSFFWTPYGKPGSMNFEEAVVFVVDGNKYEWRQYLSNNCKNVYWSSIIMKNDKKTNILSINKLLK